MGILMRRALLFLACMTLLCGCGGSHPPPFVDGRNFSCRLAWETEGVAFCARLTVVGADGQERMETLTYELPSSLEGVCVRRESGICTVTVGERLLPLAEANRLMWVAELFCLSDVSATQGRQGEWELCATDATGGSVTVLTDAQGIPKRIHTLTHTVSVTEFQYEGEGHENLFGDRSHGSGRSRNTY